MSPSANSANDSHPFSAHLCHSQTQGCFVFAMPNMPFPCILNPALQSIRATAPPVSRIPGAGGGLWYLHCRRRSPDASASHAIHARLGLVGWPHRHPLVDRHVFGCFTNASQAVLKTELNLTGTPFHRPATVLLPPCAGNCPPARRQLASVGHTLICHLLQSSKKYFPPAITVSHSL